MEPISSLNNITVDGYSFTRMITKLILTQYSTEKRTNA